MTNYNRHDASRAPHRGDQDNYQGGYQRRESQDGNYQRREPDGNYQRREYNNNYQREGGYNREGGYQRREGGYQQREGGYNREGGYQRREGGYQQREGGYNREGGYQRREGGYQQREGGYNREGGYQRREGGYQQREGGYNREGGYQRREGGYQQREGGYNREGGYQRREGGYQQREGGYNREGGYQRREGGYQQREGGYNREGGYQRREGGYQQREGGYNREGGYQRREGGYNREGGYQRREGGGGYRGGGGGYNREGGYQRREGGYQERPRRNSPPIAVPESPFLLPEHPLTQDFQRAIGMAKGTIVDVDPRKKRGLIDIEGFQYKFEDERKRDLQRKYPIQKFKDREIQFAFWPTYSQKAAQYRKIDEPPTIKIANLRRTLPQPNVIEIIGQVLIVEETIFVMSVFSASQRKKYMVTIMGHFTGQNGDFIQMLGQLKDGGIHYGSHKVVSVDPATIAAATATSDETSAATPVETEVPDNTAEEAVEAEV